MNQPLLIAVSQRVEDFLERGERRDALDQRLCQWLQSLGFIPVPVPNSMSGTPSDISQGTETALSTWLEAIRPSAVVLSGGNNVGEQRERDTTECGLLSWAEKRRIPVLGICRGMQMMSVRASGVLKPVQGHVRTRHPLRGIIGGEVNSFHEFGLAHCPEGYEVLARSEDDEIEAIVHISLPWEGWMWHPEREAAFSSQDASRMRRLFGA